MSNLPQSDWILAGRFVDRDLPSAEAARAESRLATDPQFAAAVESLRHQSGLLSALPTFNPSEDLKERTVHASLDQVKAIMGAWPIEETNPLSSARATPAANSFDWKSAAALVASLAGVLLIGSMLWTPSVETHDGNVALVSAPAETSEMAPSEMAPSEMAPSEPAPMKPGASKGHVANAKDHVTHSKHSQLRSKIGESLKQESFKGLVGKAGGQALPLATPEFSEAPSPTAASSKAGSNPERIAKKSADQLPEIGPMLGTPMKSKLATASKSRSRKELAVNSTAPIDQIWCIHQDRNVSRETVSQILNLNEIKVQREQPPASVYANQKPVEAFYVAATRQQMMLAMSQISNNADVEMIQLPGAGNSPIADAIAQQFAGAGTAGVPESAEADAQQQQAVAPRFHKPKSQALAQQLFANSIPRSFVPEGPVPPILNAASDLGDLDFKSESESELLGKSFALQSKSDGSMPPSLQLDASDTKKKEAFPGESNEGSFGDHAEAISSSSPAPQRAQSKSQSPFQRPFQPPAAELENLEENSGEQLRQYLILVRGGEK